MVTHNLSLKMTRAITDEGVSDPGRLILLAFPKIGTALHCLVFRHLTEFISFFRGSINCLNIISILQ